MGYALVADVGATKVEVAVGTDEGKFIVKIKEETDKADEPMALSRQLKRMFYKALEESGVGLGMIDGIGIGSAGPLKDGCIVGSPNMAHKGRIPIVDPISSEFGKRTWLENDCNTAVHGERHYGAGRDTGNLVYITFSTGIGGGAYVDGHLLLGKDGNAVEIGHIIIDFEGNLVCGCGRRGHWEAYCSGNNIPRSASFIISRWMEEGAFKELDLNGYMAKVRNPSFSSRELYEDAKAGDPVALRIVEWIGRLNAIGISNVVSCYDPDLVTCGGSIALNNPELLMDPIMRYIDEYMFNRMPSITITPLGEEIVLYGALALVFHPIHR